MDQNSPQGAVVLVAVLVDRSSKQHSHALDVLGLAS